MKIRNFRERVLLFLALGAVVVVFGLMLSNLLRQLEGLSAAHRDNIQWSITQLDTEFANLSTSIADQLIVDSPDSDQTRLRLDIALSRLNVISAGEAKLLFEEDADAAALWQEISEFGARAIAISDKPGELDGDDIRELRRLTQDVRPAVRSMALIGVAREAELSEAARAAFSRQLIWTGGSAIGLLLLMTALLMILGAFMRRARERDRELLAFSQQLASTVEASLDAIVTANDDGQIIGFNRAAEEVFGWSQDEIIGMTMDETFIPHRMREAHHKGMSRYLETRVPHVVDGGRVELAALRKTGEEFPVELNITSVEDGERTTFIAYIRDISNRKINEQNLIESRDRAERLDRAKSQFLAVMSHEMRTPLNGVLGVLDLLMQTKLDSKQQRYAKIAMASSEILLEHTNEALDITRIEAGALQLSNHDFDLLKLVSSLVEVLEPLAHEKGLSLTFEIEENIGQQFHGDGNRLRQVLTNLIANAIKFTDTGGVELQVNGIHGRDHTSLTFAVKDTGIGIGQNFQEQVFEDYVTLANADGRQRRGDGLGLSISRKIARQMGGDISLESQIGEGSTFKLTIPLPRATEGVGSGGDVAAEIFENQISRNILIVEDNDINRSVLRDMLEGMGHSISEAEHGLAALAKAAEQRFDVIFMDLSMPVMDGIEATKALRADREKPNYKTSVFGLTAHGHEEYRDQASEAGMNRLFTKPIRIEALRTILERLDKADEEDEDEVLDTDVLGDLIAALGVKKIRQTADKFFDEMSDLIEDMWVGESSGLVDEVHKVKGAASLLGFSDISTPLQALEDALRSGDSVDLSGRADVLDALSKRTRIGFKEAIKKYHN